MMMKNLKKYLLPLACRVILKPVSFSEIPESVKRISCKREDVKLLTNTSNNVQKITVDGKPMFFRECKKHLLLRQYVMDSIREYYTDVTVDLHGDLGFLETVLQDHGRLKAFASMGMTNDRNSGAYRFCMGHGGACIGLPDMDPQREERLIDLVQYIWGELFSYQLNGGLKIGRYQTYNAVRNIATYRMAQLIGVEDMIPKTEYVLLCPEGKDPMFGTMMDVAPGVCMETMTVVERENVASPKLQRALNRLNLLDVLNTEKDHRTGNYHVVISNGKAENVVAFDNDSPNAFGMGGISFRSYMGCAPWCKEGKLKRPYVDRELSERIQTLRWKTVKTHMKDILNPLQLMALKRRLKNVKKILSQTPDSAFLNPDMWSYETMERELSGEYGMTYLQQFLGEQKIMEQPWVRGRHKAQ